MVGKQGALCVSRQGLGCVNLAANCCCFICGSLEGSGFGRDDMVELGAPDAVLKEALDALAVAGDQGAPSSFSGKAWDCVLLDVIWSGCAPCRDVVILSQGNGKKGTELEEGHTDVIVQARLGVGWVLRAVIWISQA